MPLSRTTAYAVYIVSALSAALFGLVGLVMYWWEGPSGLSSLPLPSSISAMLVAATFLMALRNHRPTLILVGLGLMAAAVAVIVNKFQDGTIPPANPGHLLLLLSNVQLLLLGLCFQLDPRQPTGERCWRYLSYATFILGMGFVLYSWFPDTQDLSLPAPVSFVVLGFLSLLVGLLLFLRLQWRHQQPEVHFSPLLPAIGVALGTIVLWFGVTAADNRELTERSNIAHQQSAEQVNETLRRYQQALGRLTRVWQQYPGNGEQKRQTAELMMADFPLTIAIGLYDAPDNQSYQFLSPAPQYPLKPDTLAFLSPPSDWLNNSWGEVSLLLSPESIAAGQPLMFLGVPMPDPGAEENRYATLVLDTEEILVQNLSRLLDFFSVYIETMGGHFISVQEGEFKSLSAADFTQRYPYRFPRTTDVLGQYPATFYVVIENTEDLWHTARLNQLILFFGALVTLLVMAQQNANRRLEEEKLKLHELASFDPVTGLKRRDVLEKEIDKHLDNLPAGQHIFVLFVDLDSFKPINDTMGLKAGNQLIREVARRLRQVVPAGSELSRFSSDEYIVLLRHQSRDRVKAVCRDILYAVRQPYQLEGVQVYLTASIGISQSQPFAETQTHLVQAADVAMSEAKAAGGNTFRFFQTAMAEHYNHRVRLRTELESALYHHRIKPWYQPIVDAQTGAIIGIEALARWQREDGSFVSPGSFIPVAEQTGQVYELTEQIFRQACADLAQLADFPELFVSVNMSGRLFYRGNLLSAFDRIIAEHGVDPKRIHAEVTEAIFVDDRTIAIDRLNELRRRGVSVSIDDFGTGFSSLSMLYDLPIDIIKVDRQFIVNLDEGSKARQVAKAIIRLASSLNHKVIVEGVETTAQLEFCRKLGAGGIQGFYFYRPMPFTDLQALLRSQTAPE